MRTFKKIKSGAREGGLSWVGGPRQELVFISRGGQVAAISGPMALPSFVGVDEVRLRAAAATAAVLTLAALFFPTPTRAP